MENKMPEDLSFFKEKALRIFLEQNKLEAVKFLMYKRKETINDWGCGLKDCKEMFESWVEDKEYISDQNKIAEYDKLKEENALLIEALENILSWLREYETGYFVNEVSVIKAKELLTNLKK